MKGWKNLSDLQRHVADGEPVVAGVGKRFFVFFFAVSAYSRDHTIESILTGSRSDSSFRFVFLSLSFSFLFFSFLSFRTTHAGQTPASHIYL